MAGASRPFVFRFFFDAKDAKRGADEVSGAIESIADAGDGLAREVGADLDSLERKLRSTDMSGAAKGIGTSLNKDLKREGKSAGGVFGKGFISNFGETIGSGDLSPINLISGILGDVVQDAGDIGGRAAEKFKGGWKGKIASFATSGLGLGIGAAGLGLGIALVDNIMQGIAEREAAFKARVEALFGTVDALSGEFSQQELFLNAVENLTPGGKAEDYLKYGQLRDTLGLSDREMRAILTGTASPELMARVQGQATAPQSTGQRGGGAADDEARAIQAAAEALTAAAGDTKAAADVAHQAALAQRDAALVAAREGAAMPGLNAALPQGLRFTPRVPTNG